MMDTKQAKKNGACLAAAAFTLLSTSAMAQSWPRLSGETSAKAWRGRCPTRHSVRRLAIFMSSLALVACTTTDMKRACASTDYSCFLGMAARDPDGDHDIMVGGRGNDRIDGGPGIDMAVFSGRRSSYIILRNGDYVVVSGPDDVDILIRVEVLHFDDATLDLAAAVSHPGAASNGLLRRIPVWRPETANLAPP
jgi:hypothetical protein